MHLFVESILKPFLVQCKMHPESPAMVLGEAVYTYADLAQCIAQHVAWFKESDCAYIGIEVDERIDSYAAIWAVWFCGKTAVPIVQQNSKERAALIEADCQPMQAYIAGHCPTLELNLDAMVYLSTCLQYQPSDEEGRIVLYTSGSTGIPKGAPLSGKNIAAFYRAFRKTPFDWHEGDRCLQLFDLSFDFSMLVYLPAWLGGACIYGIPRGEMLTPYIHYLLTEKQLTILPIVPTLLNYLKPYFDEMDCPNLRQLMVSGEAVPVSLVKAWYEQVPYGEIHNPYGPSECTMLSTTFHYPRGLDFEDMGQFCSIGYLFDGMIGRVINAEGELAKIDEPGELYLSGPQVCAGYLNRPALNAEKFVYQTHDGQNLRFYKTGDWVIPRADGRYDFVGRIDFQVKLKGGFRVELGEIEAVVNQFVVHCRHQAITIRNTMGNLELVLVFEAAPFSTNELKEELKACLPWYMQPFA
ncbi:MAG: amino acid adenylation domain-containing protein, partial [Chitinophagaceae bacterium]|nr:amino acid adenylation domain-containing protein [Chitinophagaceae bacterium]